MILSERDHIYIEHMLECIGLIVFLIAASAATTFSGGSLFA